MGAALKEGVIRKGLIINLYKDKGTGPISGSILEPKLVPDLVQKIENVRSVFGTFFGS